MATINYKISMQNGQFYMVVIIVRWTSFFTIFYVFYDCERDMSKT